MEKYALELNGVTKQYKDFKLDSISFTVPQGSIVGLIGENGAGKSTTINAILGLIVTEQGKISVFNGKDVNAGTKEHIGVVFDGSNYPDNLTPKKLGKVFQNIYAEWNNKKYFELLNKFELPINKKLKEFSKGMNMKYSIAVALSHNSKLLILDEATSGLEGIKIKKGKLKRKKKRIPIPHTFLQHILGNLIPLIRGEVVKIIEEADDLLSLFHSILHVEGILPIHGICTQHSFPE